MQNYGPLHDHRFEILKDLMAIPIQTGDIIYRHGDARGPLNLPFSKLVSRLTKSRFSHASMIIMQHGEPFVLEVGENGTMQFRLIDWVDDTVTDELMVSRLNDLTPEILFKIEEEIKTILKNDPDYDYTFTDPDKFYCTESVNFIAERVGRPICKPELIKDIVPKRVWPIFKVINFFFKIVARKSIPFDIPFYYVGNKERGMMSSKALTIIYDR